MLSTCVQIHVRFVRAHYSFYRSGQDAVEEVNLLKPLSISPRFSLPFIFICCIPAAFRKRLFSD